ncbi:MAG: helix-turn-helix transcriptional regulator [Oscillospiraceae bacterium]|nr:helix-turn-helix transcriptional regulator [Oscillospiraceae bacterium]
MHYLFEKQDSLNNSIECFIFDASKGIFPVRPHWHYFAELIFMLRGSAEMTSDDRTYLVREGDLMIFHPSSVHSIFSTDGSCPLYAVFKFDLLKFPSIVSYAPSSADIFRYARSNNMQIHFDRTVAELIKCRDIFNDCINEINNYQYGVDVMLRSQIYRLIFGIIRQWINAGLNIDECPISANDNYGIENITEYIDSRLEENIRVSDIAEKCHLSYSGFAAKFHEQYGMSCKEYIERMRIFKAEEYLLFTSHDLTFISQQTGFSDCSHFIRSFKKYRGITPKQFRLQKKHSK